MKRTIVSLSLMLVLAVAAFAQTSRLNPKAQTAGCAGCCADGCGKTCCPDGCGGCCDGK